MTPVQAGKGLVDMPRCCRIRYAAVTTQTDRPITSCDSIYKKCKLNRVHVVTYVSTYTQTPVSHSLKLCRNE